MLLQFSVRNFRSFGDEVVLGLVANAQKSRRATLDERVRRPVAGGVHALTSAAIFGPNASGKSNLFKALWVATRLVLHSARDGQAEDPLPIEPFRLHTGLRSQPSAFEFIFECEGVRYRYGFEANAERVLAEWLYRTRQRESLVFEREGAEFRGQKSMELGVLGPRARPNALFLSVAAQLNHALAKRLLQWFHGVGFVEGIHDINIIYTARQLADETPLATSIRRLMVDLDLSLTDVTAKRRALRREDFSSDLPPGMVDYLTQSESYQISTSHSVVDDTGAQVEEAWFDLDDESRGTQKLFALAGPLADTLRQGKVMVIDEFDARLHPLVGQSILDLFNHPRSNPHGAQLLVMTHNAQILDLSRMRRDQLWFLDKDRAGQSELYSLAEIKGVRNDAAVEKSYLHGRYGATPRPRIDTKSLLGDQR